MKMMNVDENVFFRQATLRICSSLDIETALKRCFEYIRAFHARCWNGPACIGC